MIGRLYNKMRKERKREELRERLQPQEEQLRAEFLAGQTLYALLESDAPWRNTRRIKCACGITVRYDIPRFPITLACTKCGGRQTLLK